MLKMWFLSLFVAAVASDSKINNERVIGGKNYTIVQVPYQVQLLGEDRLFMCGATTVSKNYIITAAHCTDGHDKLSARFSATKKNNNGFVISITDIHQHPQYNAATFDYDISILKLFRPLVELGTPGVNALKLPTTNEHRMMALLTGWGWDQPNSPNLLNATLKGVTLPIVIRSWCVSIYGEAFTDRMLCAGFASDGLKNPCVGDDGGPLNENGALVGIVSWGNCSKTTYVYTDVFYFVSWIKEITGI